jgi:hypothetical protein
LADILRPAGGVFDAGTGIGALGSVAVVEDEDEGEDADDAEGGEGADPAGALGPATAGFGALPSDPAAACALAGRAKPSPQTIQTVSRRITRG